jgi:hypothetical protein
LAKKQKPLAMLMLGEREPPVQSVPEKREPQAPSVSVKPRLAQQTPGQLA